MWFLGERRGVECITANARSRAFSTVEDAGPEETPKAECAFENSCFVYLARVIFACKSSVGPVSTYHRLCEGLHFGFANILKVDPPIGIFVQGSRKTQEIGRAHV